MQILTDLQVFAATKGALILLGSDYFQSLVGNKIQPAKNQIVIAADFNATINRVKNTVDSRDYSGIIAYGRKFEDLTHASIAEKFEEKLNARVAELAQIAEQYNGEFACMFGYTILSERIILQLNKYASNIDFVACQISLRYD